MATYTVTTGNDETVGASLAADQADGGGLSLREAINWANASDTITFDASLAGSTLTLTQGQLAISKTLTIDGDTNGDDKADITISGDADGSGTHNVGDSGIFFISSGTFDLKSLTLTSGYGGSGGAIYLANGATLNLDDSTISDSKSTSGGGGIDSSGTVSITNSTVTGNVGSYGGGLYGRAGTTTTITNSTFDDNTATSNGGAISLAHSTATLYNSTVSDNTASGGSAGGIELYNASTITLVNTVVAGNVGTGGVNDIVEGGTNSTINTTNSFLGVAVTIDTDTGGNSINGGGDAMLGALQDNGGTVQTRNAQLGSQLINAGSSAAVPGGVTTDANGDARIQGASVDIGATETSLLALTVTQNDDTDTVGASLAADLADGGGLSLREAINWADAGATITFDASLAGSTLTLTQGELGIGKDLTIDGDTNGDDKADITISGDADGSGTHNAGDSRIFNISTGTINLDSLTMTEGYSGSSNSGGAINLTAGTLNLTHSTVSDSKAGNFGGGIYTAGDLNVTNSTIVGNQSGTQGGGVYLGYANGVTPTFTNVTIDGNTAGGHGGGIYLGPAFGLILQNSTVTGNAAAGTGGGIALYDSTATVINSVVALNTGSGGADDVGETGTTDTLNTTNSFFGATVAIDTDTGGNSINGGGDPLLGALQDNGGTVHTRNANSDSLLINTGANTAVPGGLTTDANDGARTQGQTVDIGATEASLLALTVTRNDDTDTVGASLTADRADGGGLSLREAIHWADAGATISFDASLAGSTLTLTQGELGIGKDLTIDGDTNGDDKADITISGDADGSGTHNAGDSRIFHIVSGTTNLNSLTLTEGYSSGGGGAVRLVPGATLNLTDSTVKDSKTSHNGGGIASSGTLNVSNSTISGNVSGFYGGGMFVDGLATFTNTTIHDNTSTNEGGGIDTNAGSTLVFNNSTITDNTSGTIGGGIDLYDGSTATLVNTVVAGNADGSGANDIAETGSNSTLNTTNSFLGVAASIDTDTGSNSINGGGNALLGALQDNGGPVHTRNALSDSSLINAGSNAAIPSGVTNDANGGARTQGASVDIGATETSILALTVTQNDDSDTVGVSLAADLADGGGLSLREAIHWADAGATISFDASLAGSTLTLTQGVLGISKTLTIDGDTNGDDKADITISGDADGSGTHNAGDSRIFFVTSGTTNLNSLTLTEGYSSGNGGAVRLVSGATLNLTDSTVSDSKGSWGGGIYSLGTLNVSGSTISGNEAAVFGGGVGSRGDGTFINTTIDGNTALRGGGVITSSSGTNSFYNSTITDNTATVGLGGGMYLIHGGTNTLVNSVLAQNNGTGSYADIIESGGGSTLNTTNSFFGTTVSIDTDTGGKSINGGGDAKLGALQDNGGTVHTHNALSDSPLINAGSNAVIPSGVTNDANGGARTQGASVDIGATETSILALTVTQNDDTDTVGASLAADLADGGGLSLREAIHWADAGAVITFDAALAGSTLTLRQGDLDIGKSLTIDGDTNGDNKADITISGDADGSGTHNVGDSRIFDISAGTINLNSLTMTDGFASSVNGGAMIIDASATVHLADSTIRGNKSTNVGGGISNDGSLVVTNSTISDNTAANGGGIYVFGGSDLTLTNSTISGNTATGNIGGGITLGNAATATIANSTITDNEAVGVSGGGIFQFQYSTVTLTNSVVASNTSGSNFADIRQNTSNATTNATNSFFGTNVAIDGTDVDNINNGGDAKLGALQDNGGTVFTHNTLINSPLVNAGSDAAIPGGVTTDANGGARIQGASVDIGATETSALALMVTQNDDTDTVGASLAADLADGGGLSLREAINWADAGATITFDTNLAGSTLRLTQGDLDIAKTLTIDGDTNGDDKADITISGDADGSDTHNSGDSRIFNITSGTTDLDSLTLTGGHSGTDGFGGAINLGNGAALNLSDSTVSGNYSGESGGGIYSRGTLTITDSTLSGNEASTFGGGIYVTSGSLGTLTNVTIDGNTAGTRGGGIEVGPAGQIAVHNSTITDNMATTDVGGGINLNSGATATLTNSVVAGNGGGGVYDDIGETGPNSTLNTTNVFFGTTETIDTDTGGNSINGGGDPLLGALRDNGGTVFTRNALKGSQLIDAGDNASVPGGVTEDANGNVRIKSGTVDIGATETSFLTVTQNDDTDTIGASLAADMADGGGLSLREAINWAGGGDRIAFDASLAGSTLTLTQGDLGISKSLTIDGDTDGDGKADITISGDADGSGTHNTGDSRIFTVYAGTTSLNSLTLTDGFQQTFSGGAIHTDAGTTLNLTDVTLRDSEAGSRGGGIFSKGALNLSNSTVHGNSSDHGGGVYVFQNNTATIVNSTIHGNDATTNASGLYIGYGVDLNLTNSNVTDNSSSGIGRGVVIASGATLVATNSVIAGNTHSAGGLDLEKQAGSALTSTNSFFGTTVAIDTDNGGNTNNGGDAMLGTLQDNGGTVFTQNALLGSTLVNAGSNAGVPSGVTTDANGDARIQGPSVDIGATETAILALTVTQNDDTDTVGTSLAADLADGGGLSLREAINWADAGAKIDFDASLAGSTLTLTQGYLLIGKNLTIDGDIDGDTKADITISGDADQSGTHSGGDSRVFAVASSSVVNFDSLTISDGFANAHHGAGIYIVAGSTANLSHSTLSNNKASLNGGGFLNNGTFNAVNSTISGNEAGSYGGAGLVGSGDTASFVNTTIHGNTAGLDGGGIDTSSGATLNFDNSTVTDNTATGNNGGISLFDGSTLNLVNSVLAGNIGNGVANDIGEGGTDSTVHATNSFLGAAAIIDTDNGGNSNGGGDAGLGELLDHGGSVLTRSPLDGSALIGAGSNAALPLDVFDVDGNGNTTEVLPLDARGGVRIVGGTVDIGAVEKITDETITGTDADNMIFGGAGADTLNGLGGADTLDGGTGADIMKGGKGDDTYLVDNSGDKVSEAGGNGTDSVTSSVTFKLGGGLETLLLTGTGNIRAIGNNADNTLTGNSGKNILNGGKGADTMNGKGGNDRYVVDNAGDKVSEAGGNGVDTVRSSVTYKLGGGLEKLTLFSNGNTNGTGNGADNTIAGNGGNNKLVGNGGKDKLIGSGGADTLKGGAGNDTLKGGADNDTLQGDAGDDKIFGGGGVDTVIFAAKFSKFTVTKVGNKIKVVDTTGKFGTDDLREVEKLKFGSKVMTVAEALAAKSQKAAPGISEGDEADAYTAGHDGFDPDAFTFNMGDWWG